MARPTGLDLDMGAGTEAGTEAVSAAVSASRAEAAPVFSEAAPAAVSADLECSTTQAMVGALTAEPMAADMEPMERIPTAAEPMGAAPIMPAATPSFLRGLPPV